MNSAQILPGFLSNGKIDFDFEIKDGYVIGICRIYPERTAGNAEYMIGGKSPVELDKKRGISACAREAQEQAYKSAVSHFLALPTPARSNLRSRNHAANRYIFDGRTQSRSRRASHAEGGNRSICSCAAC